jgi:hypothetical protein
MKRITLACLLLFCITSFAQQGINYKALIKDGSGVIVSSTAIDVTFTILDVASNVYEETHAPTTDANGIVMLNIGEGAPVTGDFSTIDWSSNNHFLKVQIDTGGGLQDMGTTAFKTVPYALQSKTATTATTATTLPGGIDQGYIAALEARIAALEPATVGDLRDGGVVFWLDGNGGGLVCAFSDYATELEWGCMSTDLLGVPNVTSVPSGPSGPGAEIGDGEPNTNSILTLTDCPSAPAALAARSYGPEWFLPSVNELKEMYLNKVTLEAVSGFSAFGNNPYFSSTENSSNAAWFQGFINGVQDIITKDYPLNVRAVRAF